MTHQDSSMKAHSSLHLQDSAAPGTWRGLSRASTTLHMPTTVRRQLSCLVEMSYPFEVRGLLIGRRVGTTIEVHDIEQARDAESSKPLHRHLVHPCHVREDDLQVVGVFCSRPNTSAEPTASELDTIGRGYSSLLISVSALGTTIFRSWRRVGRTLQEETLSQPRPLRA